MLDWLLTATAWAQEGGGEAAPEGAGGLLSGMGPIVPLILVFLVFYFLIIRPNQKKQKLHREMISTLKKGDYVLTNGGIYGKITGISDNTLVLEIAPQVKVKVSRTHIAGSGAGEARPAAPGRK